jgi:hypothetical protein
VGLYDVPKQPRIHLTGNIINHTPSVICRGMDTHTHRRIFSPDSGISSHSFGRSYRQFKKVIHLSCIILSDGCTVDKDCLNLTEGRSDHHKFPLQRPSRTAQTLWATAIRRITWTILCSRKFWDSIFGPLTRIIDGRPITRGQFPIPRSIFTG